MFSLRVMEGALVSRPPFGKRNREEGEEEEEGGGGGEKEK